MTRSVELATFLETFATQLKFQVLFEVTMCMSVWSSAVGETLNTKPDNRDKVKDFDKFAIGVCKRFICLWVMYQLKYQVYAITFSTIMNKTS